MIKVCEKDNQLEAMTSEEKISKGMWGGIFAEFFQALMDNSLISKHKNIASSIEYSLEKQKNKLKKEQKEFKNYIFIVLGICVIFFGIGIRASNFKSAIIYIGYSSLYAIPNLINLIRKTRGNKKSNIYLEEMLIEEKQIVKDLEEQQNQEFEQTEEHIEIENELNKMNNQAVLNYQYGYNYKKWLLYYKFGNLRNRLEKKYSEEDCDKIENWLAFDTFKKEENKLLRKLEK